MDNSPTSNNRKSVYIEVILGALTAYMLYKYVLILWILAWSLFYIVAGRVTDELSYAVYYSFIYGSLGMFVYGAIIGILVAIRYLFIKKFERFFKYLVPSLIGLPVVLFLIGYIFHK